MAVENSGWAIGIDLGGTKIAAALVNEEGEVIHEKIVATHANEGADSIVKRISDLVVELRTSAGSIKCRSVGIAVAGQVEPTTGSVIFAPNLNWHNFSLKMELEKQIDLPIVIVNDVRAATYGEWCLGAGKGLNDFICLFVGTGIGGGIVSGGLLMQGKNNSAGELGHMVIDIDGRQCTCGNRGCLEALASGWAIAKIAQELVRQKPDEGKALLKAAKGKIEAISAKDVCRLTVENDPLSMEIMDGMAKALSAGIVTLVNAFNPSHIILGGGLMNGIPLLVERITASVKKDALRVAVESLTIVQAGLKTNAGVVGAAKLALTL